MASTSSKKVTCNTNLDPNANQYYGVIFNDHIRYEDGGSVTIKKYLGVKFKSPSDNISFNAVTNPWIEITPEISAVTKGGSFEVTAKLSVQGSHTFTTGDTLSWGINGNLIDDPKKYTDSFELYVDELPSGIVEVACASAPDPGLVDSEQIVQLKQGSRATDLSLSPGETKSFQVVSGKYVIKADDLTTEKETIVAPAEVLPSEITVETDETKTIKVTYGKVYKYCSLDVKVGQLDSPINKEQLHVKVIQQEDGETLAEFYSPTNHTTAVRQLPLSGDADIEANLILNNLKYVASKSTSLVNEPICVTIDQSDFETKDIDTSGFVDLPIEIDTDSKKLDATISVRLTSSDKTLIYTQVINRITDSSKFSVPVAPNEYTVQVTGFVDDFIVYVVKGPAQLTVASDGLTKLKLTTHRGACLKVHGFPQNLSFGALTDLVDLNGLAFIQAWASSAFRYAGNDGAGDAGRYLDDDPVTTKTVQLANKVEEALGSDHPVLPVLVSYTVNLSGGNMPNLQDKAGLAHSFGNLILSLTLAKKAGKESVPAGYIVNPDFLGECQSHGLGPDHKMPVCDPLKDALKYRKVEVEVPGVITDTLQGYVVAVNWLIRTVAEKATFGWQVNLWGVGTSAWIYNKDDPNGPANKAKETAEYVEKLGVYSGEYCPDFLAVDRYEGDDFTQRAYINGYCYGPYEWDRFFDFCGVLSLELQVPVMPWQIPASRIPNKSESIVNLETDQWGSGGTYIFGDDGIGDNCQNIHPEILAIKLGSVIPHATVEDLFTSAQPFDLSYPVYQKFPLLGIFSVLLGGGSTTGIVSSIGTTGTWTQEKLKGYSGTPIPLDKAPLT
ncbi:putative hydroxymethyltransferase [Biscogniauxia sp. FL1348]|nr:putative hydroxymethyltransferase [Biscogniauxia sp. FL1348]